MANEKEETHQTPQVLADAAAKVEELLALLRTLDGFVKCLVLPQLKLEEQPEADARIGTEVPCLLALINICQWVTGTVSRKASLQLAGDVAPVDLPVS